MGGDKVNSSKQEQDRDKGKDRSRSISRKRNRGDKSYRERSRSKEREKEKKREKGKEGEKEKKRRFEKKEGESKWGQKVELMQDMAPPQLQNVDYFETGAIQIGVDGRLPNYSAPSLLAMQAPEQVLQNTQKNLFNKFFTKEENQQMQQQQQQALQIGMAQQQQMNTNSLHNDILQSAGIVVGQGEQQTKSLKNSAAVQQKPQGQKTQNFTMPLFQYCPGMNPNLINTLNDPSKVKRKIYVPNDNFNYTGLIIGPKGSNQKRMEEEYGCKILVRGQGSQKEGQLPQPDDNEPQHVLIVGDDEYKIQMAVGEIERIIFADDDTRNKIRQEQLKIVAQLKYDPQNEYKGVPDTCVDLALTTPYGRPSEGCSVIPVPNDCVGLVIGKQGTTIKMLAQASGCRKVQVAADSAVGSTTRNVFAEGEPHQIEEVKRLIKNIVDNQQKMKAATTNNASTILNSMLLLGGLQAKFQQIQQQPVVQVTNINGVSKAQLPVEQSQEQLVVQQLKNINMQTGAFTYIPNALDPKTHKKSVIITGKHEQVLQAANLIQQLTKPPLKQTKHQLYQLQQIQQQYNQAQNHLLHQQTFQQISDLQTLQNLSKQ